MGRDIWVVSDTHFNHANILKFTDRNTNELVRKFSDVEEMNEHMIDRWNSVVKPGDKIYHLGDVVMGPDSEEWMKKNWNKLHGSKRLIVGNHDNIKMLSKGGWFSKVEMWRMFPEFKLLLTHVPVHIDSAKRYASKDATEPMEPVQMLNIHGHLHQNPSPEGPYRSVCVEHIDYTPINIEELRIE